jgi:mono/diheme cytochrome c family protein
MRLRFEAVLRVIVAATALSLATAAHAAGPLAVTGGSLVAVGEYLVAIGGCNDCHTEGWNKAPGAIPPAQRLAGVAIGWHGPWGTSYAINLRLLMQRLSVEQWLGYVETMQPKPPMPWFNMRAMSETDLKAMYAYIRSLGPAGEATPADLPPNQKPTTPYIEATPQPPKP